MTQLVFDFPIRAEMSLETFVVCDGNRTAFSFVQTVISGGGEESSLFIHGPTGSGKTHLLTAAAALAGGAATFSFADVDGVSAAVIRASLEQRFASSPALLIDDIDRIPRDPSVHHCLWQLYNDFHAASKPVIVTAAISPREISLLDDHLASRLLWGLAARIDITDDDSLRMIMKKLAADRNVILPAEVIDYLLSRLPRSVPALSAALDRVCRHAVTTKRRISVPLTREALDLHSSSRY